MESRCREIPEAEPQVDLSSLTSGPRLNSKALRRTVVLASKKIWAVASTALWQDYNGTYTW